MHEACRAMPYHARVHSKADKHQKRVLSPCASFFFRFFVPLALLPSSPLLAPRTYRPPALSPYTHIHPIPYEYENEYEYEYGVDTKIRIERSGADYFRVGYQERRVEMLVVSSLAGYWLLNKTCRHVGVQ